MRKIILTFLAILCLACYFVPGYLTKAEIINIGATLHLIIWCISYLALISTFFIWENHWHIIYKIPAFKCGNIDRPEKEDEAYVSSPYHMPLKEVKKWLKSRNDKLVSMKRVSGDEFKVLKARGVMDMSGEAGVR